MIEVLTPSEENKIHAPTQDWSDSFALKVVKADFEFAQNYRRYHDQRWELADRLYAGWEKQRTWEGTKIPRSSLGMFVVFQQIESLLPKVLSSIFSDSPWFEVGPQPGTTARQSLAVRDVLLHQLEQGRRLNNQSVREVFRRSIKSGFVYGNGIVELSWLDTIKRMKRLSRDQVPVTMFGMPSGRSRYEVRERFIEKRYQLPQLSYTSLKDFYIDPNCPGPQVQQGRYAIKRALTVADYLKSLRGKDGFKIPSDLELSMMAKHKPSRQADVTKAGGETARGNAWQPSLDTSLDPGARRIEIISYYTADRCVWVANPGDETQRVIYNEVNEYGFIPFFNAFYTDFLDRFYGLAVTDVTEGEHRLQGAVVNARIDELALTIHGGTVKRRGASIPAYQLRKKPGRVIEVENPKEDIVFEQTQNITQQAYVEVSASDARVQKTTGITDLAVMGTPGGGGNSANRTATGVGVQAQAAFSRLTYLVENLEDTFVEPLLIFMHELNRIFLDPNELLRILSPSGEEVDIDPIEILNADVMFYMRASSKMQSRMALLQTFPLIAQTFMNPELISQMQRQGKTFDFEELWTMLLDMTGYKTRGKLVRQLSDEEKKALAQAQASEENIELVKQRERMQAMGELQEAKSTADIQKTVVDNALKIAAEKEKPKEMTKK